MTYLDHFPGVGGPLAGILSGSILHFGEFELDCRRFELRRKGKLLRVEHKPMELLILLASREGEIVTRTEIAGRLWSSDVFVDTEHGINTAIRKLRYLLRDDPDKPQFIQTVTGTGYRFLAPVSAVEPDLPAIATAPSVPAIASPPKSRQRHLVWYVGLGACLFFASIGVALYKALNRPREIRYTQLTDFADSAVAPVLSSDGRMLAFIRGGNSFLTRDQIYVKMLPDGEPRRVTQDDRPKYGLAFSPDGSVITYTVMENAGFSTYEVSTFGGEPQLLLKNAAGLVWLDRNRVLFSEIQSGIHMGVVTATTTRADLREIYFPAHERGMAHYSFPSPDRHWALVVEMNGNGDWAQCKLIALVEQKPPRSVGPDGACTSAGWSADGDWMFFTATTQGQSYIWRQRFPGGEPQQITFGPTDEVGIAVEPAGRALITSVGAYESTLWIHHGNGDRQLSSEGEVLGWPSPPVFSPDISALYYLLRTEQGSDEELWRTAVDSGKNEAVFPGISMTAFDISPDGKQAVFTTVVSGGPSQLWVAPLDRSSSPTQVRISGARSPHFGQRGQILFQKTEGNVNYLEQINPDGSHHSKVLPYPIEGLMGVSPGRRWVTVAVPNTPERNLPAIMAIPIDGGAPRQICASYCVPTWSTNRKFLFVSVEDPSRTNPGRSLAIPLGPRESIPDLPSGGIPPDAEPNLVRGAKSVNRAYLVPGENAEQYAWVNYTAHRNLYRISLP